MISTVIALVIFILVACLSVLILKLIVDSIKRKGKLWAVNLRPVNCPNCDQNVPYMRRPNSTRQALWGGWTCSDCGIEMDKWGTDISASDKSQASGKISRGVDFAVPFDDQGKTPIERVIHEEDQRT